MIPGAPSVGRSGCRGVLATAGYDVLPATTCYRLRRATGYDVLPATTCYRLRRATGYDVVGVCSLVMTAPGGVWNSDAAGVDE
jgi:hypothetical protein